MCMNRLKYIGIAVVSDAHSAILSVYKCYWAPLT